MTATSSSSQTQSAFTRLELTMILAALALVCLVVLPALANTKSRGDRVVCANNLRLIGRAIHMWMEDPRSMPPWWTPMAEGGTRFHQNQSDVWFNFAVLSNELKTASILACPSDPQTRVAIDFSNKPGVGLFHVTMQNNAVSYWLELDWLAVNPGPVREIGVPVGLIGDRNLRVDRMAASCSSGARNVAEIMFPSTAQWTNGIHGTVGNVLLTDGQVEQVSNSNLAPTILPPIGVDGPSRLHLLMPR